MDWIYVIFTFTLKELSVVFFPLSGFVPAAQTRTDVNLLAYLP